MLPNSVDLPEERKFSVAQNQPLTSVASNARDQTDHTISKDPARRPRSADTTAPDASAASDNEPARPRVQRTPISELVRDEPSDAHTESRDSESSNMASKAKKSSDSTGEQGDGGEKGDEEERPPPEKGVVAWLQSPLPTAFGSTASRQESPSKPLPPPRVRSAKSPPAALNPIRVAPASLPAKLTLAPLVPEHPKAKHETLQHEDLSVVDAAATEPDKNSVSLQPRLSELSK